MEAGLSTHCIGERRICPEDIAALVRGGIRLIEVGSGLSEELFGDRAYVASLAAALAKYDAQVCSLHCPHGIVPRHGDLGALAEVTRRKGLNSVRRSAETLARLGGEVVVVHPGEWFFCWDEKPDHMRAVGRSLAEAAEICARHKLKLAIETMRPDEPRIGDDYHDLLALMAAFPAEEVGLCLDTNHANLKWDLARLIADAGARLMSLHISDNDGKEEQHWLPFDGVINWAGFCAALTQVGYPGPMMYEVHAVSAGLEETVRAVVENHARLVSLL